MMVLHGKTFHGTIAMSGARWVSLAEVSCALLYDSATDLWPFNL